MIRVTRSAAAPLLASLLLIQSACAGMDGVDLGQVFGSVAGAPLDQSTVASGLRQALDVGIRRTTSQLSAAGAFAGNPALRLRLPGELGPFAQALRGVGLGGQVDALEAAMNRAAEEAAGQAVPVFVSAIASMSIADAFSILNGERDAATRYFQARTSAELARRFAPIASDAMRQVGVYSLYEELRTTYDRIPLVKPASVDLESYVADRTLDALFGELAEEEARIRQDPAARSTELLRRVFGASRSATEPVGAR